MKFLLNKETGQRYCLHCRSYNCICLPEGECLNRMEYLSTRLEVKRIIRISDHCDKLIFYKQKLPNGRIISGDSELMVPTRKYMEKFESRRTIIYLANDIINQAIFK